MSLTDRNVYIPPTLPSLGAVGSFITDPTFGTKIWRVTDANTRLDAVGATYNSPGAAAQHGWNSDGTKFYASSNGGSMHIFNWDPVNKVPSYNRAITGNFDVTFSTGNPNYIYTESGANGHTVVRIDLSTSPSTVTPVVSCETLVPGIPNPSYMNAIVNANGNLAFTCGGTSQDAMTHCIWYPIANPAGAKVINTQTYPGLANFNHSCQIDQSGRYVLIFPSGGTPYQVFVWDTALDTVTPITYHGFGHVSCGWGTLINADSIGAYDGTQWIFRPLSDPNNASLARELVNPLRSPRDQYGAEHTCYNMAQNGVNVPVTSETYRVYDGAPPQNQPRVNAGGLAWNTWDNEIVSIQTDGVQSKLWRHLHHRSQVFPDTGTAPYLFDYTPRVNVPANGTVGVFTSNWEKSLGIDAFNSSVHRCDLFVFERLLDAVPPPPTPTHRRHGRFGR